MSTAAPVTIEPMDEHNLKLVGHVHPPEWKNPAPADKYNLVVIGAGTAGLVTAAGAAGLGAKVALIERHLMGGDCLNVGCVPSKCIIRSGRLAAEMKTAARLGITSAEPDVDFAAVMRRMREVRAGISHVDSAQRFTELGVDIFMGDAKFTGPDTVEVDGDTLKFKKAVIASGARAAVPPVEGLHGSGALTNESVFSLTELPKRLAVIGSGPIGCELAQAFNALGSEVTVIEMMGQVMGREDADAAAIVHQRMVEEGVVFLLNAQMEKVAVQDGQKHIDVAVDGVTQTVAVDEILIGAGRQPNVDGMGLDVVGVEYDPRMGIKVDDTLRTSNPSIYAAGDVCMAWKFTHAAEFAARAVIQNALFRGSKKLSSLVMPWCTYTHPEVAHVGKYARELDEEGTPYDTYLQPFEDVDRALAEGDTEGFVKVHASKGGDKILGATIVASNAGDMISEITLAMTNGLGLKAIANTIHPYPTQADAIRQIANQYSRTRLTPTVKRVMEWWLNFTR